MAVHAVKEHGQYLIPLLILLPRCRITANKFYTLFFNLGHTGPWFQHKGKYCMRHSLCSVDTLLAEEVEAGGGSFALCCLVFEDETP